MSFAAVEKQVATLERARLLLERYESLWRHRAAAIDRILAEDPEH